MFPLEHIASLIDYKFSTLHRAEIFIKYDDSYTATEDLTNWFGLPIQSNGHMSTYGERLNYDPEKFLIPLRKIDYEKILFTVDADFRINFPTGHPEYDDASSWREARLVNYRYDTDTFATFKQIYMRPYNLETSSSTTIPAQERRHYHFSAYRNIDLNPKYFWGIGLAFTLFPGDTISSVQLKVSFDIA